VEVAEVEVVGAVPDREEAAEEAAKEAADQLEEAHDPSLPCPNGVPRRTGSGEGARFYIGARLRHPWLGSTSDTF
jgi:hypothetical protein